jgi:flagellar motor switch protein FliN/FliY
MDELKTAENTSLDSSNPFTSVPIEISVCVGKARPMVRELVSLKEAAVLKLDRSIDDPVELFVGEKLIARGILEEQEGATDGQLVVRISEILDLQP